MKTAIIKWDESMAERCLARCRDDVAQSGKDSRKLALKTAGDIQWEDFEKALNKALKK